METLAQRAPHEELEVRVLKMLGTAEVVPSELLSLVTETKSAITVADQATVAARTRAMDPVLAPDASQAHAEILAAELVSGRLRSLLRRLEAQLSEVEVQLAEEKRAASLAQREAEYEHLTAEQTQLAAELQELYPKFSTQLPDLLHRIRDFERRALAHDIAAPAGDKRRLLGVELVARGLSAFSRDCPSVTQDLVIPDWERNTNVWPPRRVIDPAYFGIAPVPDDLQ